MEGLYRRFDGEYFVVLGTAQFEDKKCVRMFNLTNSRYEIIIPLEVIDSKEYSCTVIEGECKKEEKRPIINHPDNVIGQETYFMRVTDIDNIVSSFSTEQLIRELGKRNSILQDVDFEELNDKVYCSELVVGEKREETEKYGNPIPKGVMPYYVPEDMEEAVKYLEKKTIGNRSNRLSLFKRVWIELTEDDIIEHLQKDR